MSITRIISSNHFTASDHRDRPRARGRLTGRLAIALLAIGLLGVGLLAAACGGTGGNAGAQPADSNGSATPAADEPLALSFMAGFRAQSNLPFIAVYVAQQEGYFDDVGLTITIRHSAGQGEHVRLLLAGEIEVTTQPASELLQRRSDPGAPLVAVALFGQSGDLGYAVLAGSGIDSVADFRGKTIGFKGVVQAEFVALLAANGLTVDDVDLVTTGFNPVVLAERQLDVYPVFLSNEPDTLERILGVPVRVFQAADDGVPTLGVSYVVSEDGLADPTTREALRRFLWATIKGFHFALDNPAAAIKHARAFIPEEADLDHERFILDTELANSLSPRTENIPGWFTEEQFQALHDVLLAFGGIENAIEVAAAIDRSILESIYEDGVFIDTP